MLPTCDDLSEDLEAAAASIRAARRVAVLTGAGVSADSGVPTFRGHGGLWRDSRPEDLATPEAFARDPKLVWEWYDWRRQKIAAVEPNAGHIALAELEGMLPRFTVITQNVDGLHEAAGSRNIVELHGCIWRVRCTAEGTITGNRDVPLREIPPHCGCGALLRPDVVWFGEAMPSEAMAEACQAAEMAQVMLVVGTSALVYPAAALPHLTSQQDGVIVEVNPEPTMLPDVTHIVLRGGGAEVLPQLVAAVDRAWADDADETQ
ncbi:MAG: NAD-dependent deacylase [Armatimonadota bacterium]|jgi:NAD-dependent deacetylase